MYFIRPIKKRLFDWKMHVILVDVQILNYTRQWRGLLILGEVLVILSLSYGEAIYATPDGRGSGASTEQACSVAEALALLAERTATVDADSEVSLVDGVYELEEALQLNASHGGQNGHQIVRAVYAGAHPILSGGTELCEWREKDGTAVYVTNVSERGTPRVLDSEPYPQYQARYPNPQRTGVLPYKLPGVCSLDTRCQDKVYSTGLERRRGDIAWQGTFIITDSLLRRREAPPDIAEALLAHSDLERA